jgi:hypothetical protein
MHREAASHKRKERRVDERGEKKKMGGGECCGCEDEDVMR